MDTVKISLTAKRKRKFSELAKVFSNLGFTRMSLLKDKLILEKALGKDLQGSNYMDYKIVFEEKGITFFYTITSQRDKRSRILESLSTFLNLLILSNPFYTIDPLPIYESMRSVIEEMENIIDKDGINYTMEIDDLRQKCDSLKKRYDDLVLSSEENARILLETERRRSDLQKRTESLEGMSNETLKEELFEWVKLHHGQMDVYEFAKKYGITSKRVEEGLNMLIREGYILMKGR